MKIIRGLIYEFGKENLRDYEILEIQHTIKLYHLWIEQAVNRSRCDDAVEMRGVLKDATKRNLTP